MKNTQQQFALIFTDPRNKQTKVNTQMQKGPARTSGKNISASKNLLKICRRMSRSECVCEMLAFFIVKKVENIN